MKYIDRIRKILKSSKNINIDDSSKIIIMSDVHRGDGSWSDSFARNQNTFFAALLYYYEEDYIYIELGDGDELWEVRNFKDIVREHSDVFWLMSKFYKEDRFFMLYGNHDIVKSQEKFLEENLYYYYDERTRTNIPMFKDIKAHEGLVLNYKNENNKILLVHGHQVDFINYDIWPITRFLVRYFWRPLELYGIKDITRTAQNHKKKHRVADRLSEWVMKEKHLVIAGHNHRSSLPEIGETPYFNDGSCVHPRCITGIEIVEGSIMLVKWHVQPDENRRLHVVKDIIAGPRKLDKYFEYLNS